MRIAHIITDVAYKRVYESFREDSRFEQFLIYKKTGKISEIVPEGFDECNIKNKIEFCDNKELQNIINYINPNFCTQAEIGDSIKINFSDKCKRVFISHGYISDKMTYFVKKWDLKEKTKKQWSVFDLYCGISDSFVKWLEEICDLKDSKRYIDNSLTQLDLLFDKSYFEIYKDKILNILNKKPDKIILFFGNRCGIREDYNLYNKDYFDCIFELDRLSKINNWFIFVKPKNGIEKTLKFLNSCGEKWADQFKNKYTELFKKNNNLYLINTNSHPYRYFFADCIVSSGGGSTIEIDSAVAKKNSVIFRTKSDKEIFFDSTRSIENNAVYVCSKIDDLENIIKKSLNSNKIECQIKYLDNLKIINDGNNYGRVLDFIWSRK